MTKTNDKMTRADALTIAIERVQDMPEVVDVLTKMHTAITKPRTKREGPTKARTENERLARELRAAIPPNGEVTAKWVTEHVRGVLTTQKAAAVARVGIDLGIIAKVVDGRKVTYRRAQRKGRKPRPLASPRRKPGANPCPHLFSRKNIEQMFA